MRRKVRALFRRRSSSRIGLCLVLSLALWWGSLCRAGAETFYGEEDWKVTFTSDNKMESNFGSAQLADAVAGLQPGDSIVFSIKLENAGSGNTDWYMTNEVLYSLEDRSANSNTGGGAYTYELVYTDRNGTENILFSSDTVGGESVGGAGEGLHGATDALKDYFYLDSLPAGQHGTISLLIALDGETQGNDYQDTLADLRMNFAVEPNAAPPQPTDDTEPDSPGTTDDSDTPGSSGSSNKTNVVKTGDDTNVTLYLIAMGVSGVLLLALGIYSVRCRRKEKEEAV